MVCGVDTALGRAEYIDRREAQPEGRHLYLCADCFARSRPGRRGELSEDERRRLDDHAFMFGIAFNATGH